MVAKKIFKVKTFFILLILGLLYHPLHAQQELMLFFDFQDEGWKQDGNPEVDGVYFGTLKSLLPDGNGNFKFPDGRLYEGQWVEGWIDGEGSLSLSSGEQYTGNFKKGVFHGNGSYRWPVGDEYNGEYLKGLKHGRGRLTFPNGDRYVGSFEKGLYHGEGVFSFSNEAEFQGSYRNVGKNKTPVLTIMGGLDNLVPLENAAKIKEFTPQAEIVIYDDMHLVLLF